MVDGVLCVGKGGGDVDVRPEELIGDTRCPEFGRCLAEIENHSFPFFSRTHFSKIAESHQNRDNADRQSSQ